MKFKFGFLVLVIFTCPTLWAQESVLAREVITQGRYEIGGRFAFSAGTETNLQVLGTLGYFKTDNLSIDGVLGLGAQSGQTSMSPGLGVSYYFLKTKAFAPFVSQSVSALIARKNTFFGETRLGVNYLVTPKVGFKVMTQASYPLERLQERELSLLGAFSYFL